MLAAARGALVIEKHLTYDRNAKGPDHAASFEPKQFAEYVQLIRKCDAALHGMGPDDIEALEADVRRVSRQSVCAVRDLSAGHVITRDDITVKRPGTGIPAARFADVIGRPLKRAVKGNHLLHEGDVDLG